MVKKYKHPDIEQQIIIADQSRDDYEFIFGEEFANVTFVHTEPHYSGYGIDYLLHNDLIKTDYIAQLHVDAFPISKQWLYMPIKLIEENNYSFVGQLQFISKETDTIYPPGSFFAMAQCYNVARTSTYLEMSLEAGFTRFHERKKIPDLRFYYNDWRSWAKHDYEHRGSDDDVVAFHWQDKYRQDDKLGLAISGYIEPSYARIIDDVVFHFCSAREAIGVMDKMPVKYQEYTQKIKENYSDELVEEMIALAKANRPPNMEILSRNHWNGITKQSSPTSDELNKKIEALKQ